MPGVFEDGKGCLCGGEGWRREKVETSSQGPSAGMGTRPGTKQGSAEHFKQKRDVMGLSVSQAHSPAVLRVDSK